MEAIKKLIANIDNSVNRDLVTKALNTFWQASLVVLIIGFEQIIDLVFAGDWYGAQTAILALMIGAGAAGLSALKTFIINLVREYRTKKGL